MMLLLSFGVIAAEATPDEAKPNALIQTSSYVIEYVVMGLLAVMGYLWGWLTGKAGEDKAKLDATLALEAGVESAWNTLGAKYKKASADGKLTTAEKEELRTAAYNKALELAKGKGKDLLLLWGKDMAAAIIKKIVDSRKTTAATIASASTEPK